MDFSPLTIIKSGEDKGGFPVSTSKSRFPAGLRSFFSSLPDHKLWGIRRRCRRQMTMSIHHGDLDGIETLGAKLPDLRNKDKEKG